MTAPDFDGSQRCRETPDLFFPSVPGRAGGRQAAAAKAVCRQCPFRDLCAEFAVTHTDWLGRPLQGIWGALDEDDRAEIRKRRAA